MIPVWARVIYSRVSLATNSISRARRPSVSNSLHGKRNRPKTTTTLGSSLQEHSSRREDRQSTNLGYSRSRTLSGHYQRVSLSIDLLIVWWFRIVIIEEPLERWSFMILVNTERMRMSSDGWKNFVIMPIRTSSLHWSEINPIFDIYVQCPLTKRNSFLVNHHCWFVLRRGANVDFDRLEKNAVSFIETSALDSTNVEQAFQSILTGRISLFGKSSVLVDLFVSVLQKSIVLSLPVHWMARLEHQVQVVTILHLSLFVFLWMVRKRIPNEINRVVDRWVSFFFFFSLSNTNFRSMLVNSISSFLSSEPVLVTQLWLCEQLVLLLIITLPTLEWNSSHH